MGKKAVMKAAAMKKTSMKAAMKPAMKVAMKKKAMKVKRMSKVAKGRGAKARVLSGSKAKKAFQSSPLKVWADACKKARKALGLTGFVPMGGKTAAGKALLAKAKSLMQA